MPRTPRLVQCPQCGTAFESINTKHCSLQCASRARVSRQAYPLWDSEELAILERHAGSRTLAQITAILSRSNRRRGRPPRTSQAIAKKMQQQGLSYATVLDSLSATGLAQTLGVHKQTVLAWIKKGLPCDRPSRKRYVIQLKDFRTWAKAHPDSLAGLEADRLEWVLGDSGAAAELASLPRRHACQPISIVRTDTGERFGSIRQAGRANHIGPSTLSWHKRRGQQFVSGGFTWEVSNG